jgi:hypothetical protein
MVSVGEFVGEFVGGVGAAAGGLALFVFEQPLTNRQIHKRSNITLKPKLRIPFLVVILHLILFIDCNHA